eukprot:CAMPEP_0113828226 /NCGR_PEP_ID=MMETSP0328-20130328/5170_1 /TAXON_ID=39455 /ORGANISM="Alexandrium minutum" /LENGTH=76 /DNA_ID=CAMNT_0000796233 /DNA_START=75 /DNA_END=302 /DNA_ORIENTATION=+ /assembly_acc=CAM_ASM_000350
MSERAKPSEHMQRAGHGDHAEFGATHCHWRALNKGIGVQVKAHNGGDRCSSVVRDPSAKVDAALQSGHRMADSRKR